MSLRLRISIVLLGLLVGLGALGYAAQVWIIQPSFLALERSQATADLRRCGLTLDRELKHLSGLCNDWAAWDDSYQFVQEPNEDYRQANLVESSFTDNRLNLILFYDRQGRRVWGQGYDLHTREPMVFSEFQGDSLPATHLLLGHQRVPSEITGVIATEFGPLLVASRPILTSQNQGPSRGTLIMGRLLTPSLADSLAEMIQVPFAVRDLRRGVLSQEERTAVSRMRGLGVVQWVADLGDAVGIYYLWSDLGGSPVMLLSARLPRDWMTRARQSQWVAWVGLLLGALALGGTTIFVVDRWVLAPLRRLTSQVEDAGRERGFAAHLLVDEKHSAQEIKVLGREFNQLMEVLRGQLEEIKRSEQVQASIQTAGAACHELSQPLQALLSELELMLLGMEDDHPLRPRLERCLAHTQRLAGLTHQMNRITRHITRRYLEGVEILDLEMSSDDDPADDGMAPLS